MRDFEKKMEVITSKLLQKPENTYNQPLRFKEIRKTKLS